MGGMEGTEGVEGVPAVGKEYEKVAVSLMVYQS